MHHITPQKEKQFSGGWVCVCIIANTADGPSKLQDIMKMGHYTLFPQNFEDKAWVILSGKHSGQTQYLSGNRASVNVCGIEPDKPF